MGARRFTAKHLFCGRPRPNSLAAWLRKLAQRYGLPLKVEAIDIAVRPFVDLSNPSVQEQILSRIKRGDFFAVVLTPPCSTFSRAPWRNKRGPRPIRSFDHPDGFPTLRWVERRKARLGNSLADFSFAAAAAVLDLPAAFLLLEQPEDLGTVRPRQRPSSMWQRSGFKRLRRHAQARHIAFHQRDFGVDYAKPTRILLRSSVSLPSFMHEQLPSFDADGYYTGPLPRHPDAQPMRSGPGKAFITTGAAAWPSNMCRWGHFS